eukprot:1162108-Pelagomonas_calceolata.AAC.5
MHGWGKCTMQMSLRLEPAVKHQLQQQQQQQQKQQQGDEGSSIRGGGPWGQNKLQSAQPHANHGTEHLNSPCRLN